MPSLDKNINQLSDAIKEKASRIEGVTYFEEYFIQEREFTVRFDGVLKKNGEILAVFEYKPYQKQIRKEDIFNNFGKFDLGYKYFILTNGMEMLLVDSLTELQVFTDVDKLLEKILATLPTNEILVLKESLSRLIEESFLQFIDIYEVDLSQQKSFKFNTVKDLLKYEVIKSNIHFDSDGQYFRLGKNITEEDNFENKLFNLLLENLNEGTKIFRYATFDTIYATLSYSSIRMNGLAGMNDSSEVDYVNKYIDKSYSFLSKPEDVELINKRFICCFSTLEDTLNQWRLYGDDCKGAYLTFKVANPLNVLPGIKIKKVSYGSKKNGKPFHLELELIKFLTENIRVNFGQPFRLRSLDIWKHFFKPFEYAEEEEVRLLVVYNKADNIKGSSKKFTKEWNLTTNYKIVSPYITVPLNTKELPISLKEVVLGSKQQEKQLNLAQLELFIKEKKIKNVSVNLSTIDNYR